MPIAGEAVPQRVRLVYEVEVRAAAINEDTMHESPLHDQILALLQNVLQVWAGTTGRSLLVARHLVCRWNAAEPHAGLAPDLCVVEPSPADLVSFTELRLWEPGRGAPWLGVEVVSEASAAHDYQEAPARHARLGVRELWVFDPQRLGPASTGGPFVLQVWRRGVDHMERIYAGNGPAHSPELGAWLQVVHGGKHLRLSHDEAGKHLWMTESEVALHALQQAHQRLELDRVGREQAEVQHRHDRLNDRIAREQIEALHRAERSAREQAETAQRAAETAREMAEAAQRAERYKREKAEKVSDKERAEREQAETLAKAAQGAREQIEALHRAERSAREQAERDVAALRQRLAELEASGQPPAASPTASAALASTAEPMAPVPSVAPATPTPRTPPTP